MKKLIKPATLRANDKVAVFSPAGAEAYENPQRYRNGKAALASLGLQVFETPNAVRSKQWLYDNPDKRAADYNLINSVREMKAAIAICGGNNWSRMMEPYIDFLAMQEDPKIDLSYSDNTYLKFARWYAGQISYYGPNVMEFDGMDAYTLNSVYTTLFTGNVIGELPRNNADDPDSAWHFISGNGGAQGQLIGGCVEVLQTITKNKVWPRAQEFKDTILFLETPEEGINVVTFEEFLRNLGKQRILNYIAGLFFGKPGWGPAKVDPAKITAYDEVILKVLKEYQRTDLPVVTNLPIGHTYPMMTVPMGCNMEIDVKAETLSITESGTEG